jgi:hypothetical protein
VVTEPQSAAQSPDMAIPFGVKFTGYARYGAHFQAADQKYVAVTAPTTARPRLVVWVTKATAASSSSLKPSRAKTAPSGTST